MIKQDMTELLNINEKSENAYKRRINIIIAYLVKPFFIISIISAICMVGFMQINPDVSEYGFFKNLILAILSFTPLSCFIPTFKAFRFKKITDEVFSVGSKLSFDFLLNLTILCTISIIAKYTIEDTSSFIIGDISIFLIGIAGMLSLSSIILFLVKDETISLVSIGKIEELIYKIELEDVKQRQTINTFYDQIEIKSFIEQHKDNEISYSIFKSLIK